MKTKKRYLIIIMLLTMLLLMIKPNSAHAVLQANGGTVKTDTIDNWMMNIRNMQAAGGTLGLTDTINTDLTSTNKNLDIHMEKNTEYGAMAILSASSYGNPDPIADGQTTTGNKTGIKINLNKEWVVAGNANLNVPNFKNALGRYKNIYTITYSAKVGDVIDETKGWHNSGSSTWLNKDTYSGLVRACSGSMFSYYGKGYDNGLTRYDGYYGKTWATRAVIVVGTGI